MSSNHDTQAACQHESARLAALAQYAIANTRPEVKYDQLIQLALSILKMPIAGISFIGEKQLWIKSGVGIDACVVDRSASFCQLTLNQPEALLVSDAQKDPLYELLDCMAGDLPVRFYLGIPLITPEGFHIGAFYMMDTEPHVVDQDTLDNLNVVAIQVMFHLENRRQQNMLAQQLAAQTHLKLLETCIANQNDLLMISEAQSLTQSEPNIVFVNDAFVRHTGYQREEVLGKTVHILHGEATQKSTIEKIKMAMQASLPIKVELTSHKKNGEAFWQDLDLVPITDKSGIYTHWVFIGRDITDTKRAEDEIRHLAYYDALTQLPNHRLLTDRLRQAVLANNRFVRHGALLYLDLDHFKNLNDTAGHTIGDTLLKQVAQRLTRRMREDDTVARMGGDEFVIMLKDLDGQPEEAASQAKIVAEKILVDFQKPFLIDNQEFFSSPSIGITLFDDRKNPVEEILKRADLAMYQAKASGRNRLSFFESHMQENMTTRTLQEKSLRLALQKNELVLFYQPKINMHDEVVGVEALVRWESPEKGLLQPSIFIDLAEETGLILPLGDWVLRKACEQLTIWATQPDYQHLSMSINVSVNQFNHPDFLVQVVNIIQETGVNPYQVILEITESIFAQNIEDIVRKMHALKTIGVRFALDDFGVAYSSLSHLRNLPLDEIKIDQSFVKNIMNYSIDLAVAKSVIEIARSLKIQAVAEGIETEAQRELLMAYGCYVHQGYLFAKPMPIKEFESYCISVKVDAIKRLST